MHTHTYTHTSVITNLEAGFLKYASVLTAGAVLESACALVDGTTMNFRKYHLMSRGDALEDVCVLGATDAWVSPPAWQRVVVPCACNDVSFIRRERLLQHGLSEMIEVHV